MPLLHNVALCIRYVCVVPAASTKYLLGFDVQVDKLPRMCSNEVSKEIKIIMANGRWVVKKIERKVPGLVGSEDMNQQVFFLPRPYYLPSMLP